MKAQLTQTAIQTIETYGTQKLSFRDLGAAVGIKAPSALYHFGSKEQLITHTIEVYAGQFFRLLEEKSAALNSSNAKCHALIDIFEETFYRSSYCLCGMLAAEASNLSSNANQILRAFFDNLHRWTSETVSTHPAYPGALQADSKAFLLIGLLEGGLLMDRLNQSDRYLTEIRHWVDQVIPTEPQENSDAI
ncbi:MAG: TetR/AcrR family transcriptional regulator [Chloroflexota bacterium]